MAFDVGTQSIFFHKNEDDLFTLDCKDTAAKEDLASVGLNQVAYISCPVGCALSDAPVFGNDIYSEDSSICKAGVHAGVIGNKGGDMKI